MENKEILSYVDHTELKAVAGWEDIKKLLDDGVNFEVKTCCIPPTFVKKASEYVNGKIGICTVVGFPLGYQEKEVKELETKIALENGADEIDMVINISKLKDKDYLYVEDEIRSLKKICGDKCLKVIVETCYLTEEEKVKMCQIVENAGADFIKTSTGFGTSGATQEDVKLFKNSLKKDTKIKAAGGISSLSDAEEFIKNGAERLGTSRIVKIIKG